MTAKGNTGHASLLHENTAAEKIHKIINKLLGLRETEKARLKSNPELDIGDVTSVNMTMLSVISCLEKSLYKARITVVNIVMII